MLSFKKNSYKGCSSKYCINFFVFHSVSFNNSIINDNIYTIKTFRFNKIELINRIVQIELSDRTNEDNKNEMNRYKI